ncbi:MAG: hypothetical protein J2O48_07395 [Solirubrobacterales bacterium]|nr:hypothetical protein [Solirubrobacterales bacterium]
MSATDYIIDSALVLLVLLQLKERTLTTKALVRPLIIVAIAVANYLHGFPTQGNDIELIAVIGAIGTVIGVASGVAVKMRRGEHGEVLARAGTSSAIFWVLGMGSRFAFAVWAASAAGSHSIGQFSAQHSITSAEAWTVALLAMAVCEVASRSLVMAARRERMMTAALALA